MRVCQANISCSRDRTLDHMTEETKDASGWLSGLKMSEYRCLSSF